MKVNSIIIWFFFILIYNNYNSSTCQLSLNIQEIEKDHSDLNTLPNTPVNNDELNSETVNSLKISNLSKINTVNFILFIKKLIHNKDINLCILFNNNIVEIAKQIKHKNENSTHRFNLIHPCLLSYLEYIINKNILDEKNKKIWQINIDFYKTHNKIIQLNVIKEKEMQKIINELKEKKYYTMYTVLRNKIEKECDKLINKKEIIPKYLIKMLNNLRPSFYQYQKILKYEKHNKILQNPPVTQSFNSILFYNICTTIFISNIFLIKALFFYIKKNYTKEGTYIKNMFDFLRITALLNQNK